MFEQLSQNLVLVEAEVCNLSKLKNGLTSVSADAIRENKSKDQPEFHLLVRVTEDEMGEFTKTPIGQAWLFEILDKTKLEEHEKEKLERWLLVLEDAFGKMRIRCNELQEELQTIKVGAGSK